MRKFRSVICFVIVIGIGLALPLMADNDNTTDTQTQTTTQTKKDKKEKKETKKGKDNESARDNVNDIGNRKVAGWSIISPQKEMAIGAQYAKQEDHELKLITDPVVTEYVNRIAQNIAQNSDAKFPISVKVIDDPTINAMTLPGGFMYMTSGTILAADNEAELAGVIAHETGHVAERSFASEMSKREIMEFATLPLMFTPMGIGTYYGMNAALGTGLPIAFLKFSRNQEEGADFLGLQYMWKAGYDPDAMLAMFGKVLNEERSSPGSVAQIFSDHPPTPDRIIKDEEEIKTILPKRPEYLENTSEFNDMKARLVTDLRVHRSLSQPGQPTLKRRRQRAGNAPPTGGGQGGNQPPVLGRPNQTGGTQQGQGGDSGDQPPVLGQPNQTTGTQQGQGGNSSDQPPVLGQPNQAPNQTGQSPNQTSQTPNQN
jgi:beta-barrel assembly-enhancing protease